MTRRLLLFVLALLALVFKYCAEVYYPYSGVRLPMRRASERKTK